MPVWLEAAAVNGPEVAGFAIKIGAGYAVILRAKRLNASKTPKVNKKPKNDAKYPHCRSACLETLQRQGNFLYAARQAGLLNDRQTCC
jgi:hypothetical protein